MQASSPWGQNKGFRQISRMELPGSGHAGYACDVMSRTHQYVDAWRLKNNTKIARWLAYLLEEYRTCTLDTHLERLNRLGIKAEAKMEYNTARLCETSRAEAVGIKAATRHEVTHFDARTKDEVKDYINEIFGQAIDITPETSTEPEPDLDPVEDTS